MDGPKYYVGQRVYVLGGRGAMWTVARIEPAIMGREHGYVLTNGTRERTCDESRLVPAAPAAQPRRAP